MTAGNSYLENHLNGQEFFCYFGNNFQKESFLVMCYLEIPPERVL